MPSSIEIAVELLEKAGLVTAAAMFSVLAPTLRDRILVAGTGTDATKVAHTPSRRAWIFVLGLCLSIWGSSLGTYVGTEHMNVRALGVLIAALLGGARLGMLTGVAAGLYYGFLSGHVHQSTRVWVCVASIVDGYLMGRVSEGRKRALWLASPIRVFTAAALVQLAHLAIVAVGQFVLEPLLSATLPQTTQTPQMWRVHLEAWQAHMAKLVASAAGLALYVAVLRLAMEREEQRVALIKAEAIQRKAELNELRTRVDPHFLFNALASIAAMTRKDPEAARTMAQRLATLYRNTLKSSTSATLGDELALAEAYLGFEAIRAQGTLRYTIAETDAHLQRWPVPVLLLQPLIENAVIHGVSPYGGGSIEISVSQHGASAIAITIEDRHTNSPAQLAHDARPVDEGRQGTGSATATIRERLALAGGPGSNLIVEQTAQGTRAILTLCRTPGSSAHSPNAT